MAAQKKSLQTRSDVVRDLLFFRRTHLAVAAGCAVAAAVLTGALMVGDSVRSSLRQLTLERLGGVDHALAASRFFDEAAADRLATETKTKRAVTHLAPLAAPAILLRATAQNADTQARASDVGLQAVDGRFFELYGGFGAADPLAAAQTAIFPPVVMNQALADSLGVDVGAQVLISLQRWSEVPSGSLLARDDTASVVETLRLEVASILPNEGVGSFGLQTHQSSRFNAFVRLADLQDGLDQEGTVNSILVNLGSSDRVDVASAWDDVEELQQSLDAALGLADFGVLLKEAPDGTLVVESSEFVISPSLEQAITAATTEVEGTETWPLLTYLGNAIERTTLQAAPIATSATVPYSTLTAAEIPNAGSPFGELRLIDGSPAPALAQDQLYLNAWTAAELGYELSGANGPPLDGERIRLRYFEVGPREELTEVSRDFELAGIVAMDGLAVDSELSQEYPGIAGSTNMSDWDPPFPIDLGLISSADEAYWDDFRGAPKVWVGLEQGQDLWQTRWGRLTGVRLAPPEGTSPDAFRRQFEDALLRHIAPDAFGLQFQPVKALGLDAAAGPTDFGQLFLSMSFFVIVSAALLVALLFGLGVEQRAGEVGLRLAVGFKPASVRRLPPHRRPGSRRFRRGRRTSWRHRLCRAPHARLTHLVAAGSWYLAPRTLRPPRQPGDRLGLGAGGRRVDYRPDGSAGRQDPDTAAAAGQRRDKRDRKVRAGCEGPGVADTEPRTRRLDLRFHYRARRRSQDLLCRRAESAGRPAGALRGRSRSAGGRARQARRRRAGSNGSPQQPAQPSTQPAIGNPHRVCYLPDRHGGGIRRGVPRWRVG